MDSFALANDLRQLSPRCDLANPRSGLKGRYLENAKRATEFTSSVSEPTSRRSKGMAATRSMMNQPFR